MVGSRTALEFSRVFRMYANTPITATLIYNIMKTLVINLLILALVPSVLALDDYVGTLTHISGDVSIIRMKGNTELHMPARDRFILRSGDKIDTGRSGRVTIIFTDLQSLRVMENTQFMVATTWVENQHLHKNMYLYEGTVKFINITNTVLKNSHGHRIETK